MAEETTSNKKKWKINWTSEKIMSTSALFISVISLIALLYQSYLAREENRLIQKQQSASVLPHLNQWMSDYDGIFRIIVGNKGVGPAFITDVEITLDSQRTFSNSDALFDALFANNSSIDTIPYITSTLIKGFVLQPNEKINILEIRSQDNFEKVKQVINTSDISFKITYEDIYGSQWVLSNSSDNPDAYNIPIVASKAKE